MTPGIEGVNPITETTEKAQAEAERRYPGPTGTHYAYEAEKEWHVQQLDKREGFVAGFLAGVASNPTPDEAEGAKRLADRLYRDYRERVIVFGGSIEDIHDRIVYQAGVSDAYSALASIPTEDTERLSAERFAEALNLPADSDRSDLPVLVADLAAEVKRLREWRNMPDDEPRTYLGYSQPGAAPHHYGPDDVVVDGDWLEHQLSVLNEYAALASIPRTAEDEAETPSQMMARMQADVRKANPPQTKPPFTMPSGRFGGDQ